ncbi:MAG: hypothetical protein GTN62_06690 [Gemmatimonadales bacterium]|nr:hypothetical protein [Gemmatimonadales bacterium]NIN11185.1 hypothetical protein [Gemmatimonadales bacterium]NIN49784.1 hypothetical protein [Gemmatimonadales bacterium]NIP07248.1 hypothetical protein [Gemmatimonadales bacterium]NIR00461.1 hypothetical protein [Gemmatimonadales bacterium]
MARIVLLIAAIIEFVFRGLPGFFGSEPIANLFGLEYIEAALVYVHPLGALMLVFGVMFFIASKDPLKHRFIVDMGILRYALTIVSYFITIAIVGSLVVFWWIHLAVDVILLVLLVVSRPKAAAPAAPAAA